MSSMSISAAPDRPLVHAPTKRSLFLSFLAVGLQGFGGVLPIVGNRFRGPLGSAAATLGLMLMPFIIVLALAALYARFDDIAAVRGATSGVSAAATGLILATGFRMAHQLKGIPWHIVMCAVTFVAIAMFRMPLLWVLAVLAPVSIALAWWMMRR
jgi:chromate transporter